MKRHHLLATLTTILILTATARAQQGNDTLKAIPGDSQAFAVTSPLEQVNDKIVALGKILGLPAPPPLELIKGIGIAKGLNAKKSAAVALLPKTDNAEPLPPWVVILPVTDYKEFVGQFNAKPEGIAEIKLNILFGAETFLVGKKGSFALLTKPENRDALKKVLDSQATLGTWANPVQTWVDENDFTLVATPKGIKKAVEEARDHLAQAKNAKVEGLEFVTDWIDAIDSLLKSVETDVTHAALGVKFDKAGNFFVDAQALFAKNSGLAKSAAQFKGIEGGPLAGLPKGPFALAFGGAISENLVKEMLKVNVEMMKRMAKLSGEELPKAKAAKLEEALSQTLSGLRGMSFLLTPNKEDATLFGGMSATITVDDAKSYLGRYEKSIKESNEAFKDLKLPISYSFAVKKIKLGTMDALKVDTKIGGDKIDNDPMQKKIMDAMFGPGGMSTYVAVVNSSTVAMSYQSPKALKEMLEAGGSGGLPKSPAAAATLALLPKGSQWVLLVDAHGTVEMVDMWIKGLVPNAPVNLPAFPQTPPVAAGARLSESGLAARLVVPVEVLQQAIKMSMIKGGQ